MRTKSKKPVVGVCSSQDWSHKNTFAKRKEKNRKGISLTTLPNSENVHSKSKNSIFCLVFQCLLKGFKQDLMNSKVKVHCNAAQEVLCITWKVAAGEVV